MQLQSIVRFNYQFLASLGMAAELAVTAFRALKASLVRQDAGPASLRDGVLGLEVIIPQLNAVSALSLFAALGQLVAIRFLFCGVARAWLDPAQLLDLAHVR